MESIISQTLITILLSSQPVLSTNLCLYGRVGLNSIINGLYIEENIYDNKPYYKKTGGSCGTWYMYWRANKWVIDTTLSSSGNYYAHCGESSTASNCHTWYVSNGASFVLDSSVQLSLNSCPSWNCDAITIPNAPNNCGSFDENLGNGLWKDSTAARWWYFDDFYFRWFCADHVPTYLCSADTNYAYLQPGWTDLSKGQSASMQMEYPNTDFYTVNCIDNNRPPSNPPTYAPTSLAPTNQPSTSPTKSPSNSPTSLAPTNQPSISPTKLPTVSPTKLPSNAPTTSAPTNNPSLSPTLRPTETPTAIPSETTNTDDYGEGSIGDHETTQMSTQVVFGNSNNKTDASSFWTVFIVFLVLIFICILSLVVLFRYKYKKENSKATTHVKNMQNAVYSIDPKAVNDVKWRNRVFTHSQYLDNEDEGNGDIEAAVDDNPKTPKVPGNGPNTNHNSVELCVEFNAFNDSFVDTPGNISNVGTFVTGEDAFTTPHFNTGIVGEWFEVKGNETLGDENVDGVKEWLEDKVKLPQYYDVFVQNGYDSLDIIKIMTEENELRDMGIVLKEHILKIMAEIKCLRDEFNGQL